MKRVIAALLAAIILVGLSGCDKQPAPTPTDCHAISETGHC